MEENERAVVAMRQFLEALGLDLQALGMEKTPHRVAQAFADFFSGLKENPDDEWQDPIATQTDGLVVVRNIRFHSMCEHHLLPFSAPSMWRITRKRGPLPASAISSAPSISWLGGLSSRNG